MQRFFQHWAAPLCLSAAIAALIVPLIGECYQNWFHHKVPAGFVGTLWGLITLKLISTLEFICDAKRPPTKQLNMVWALPAAVAFGGLMKLIAGSPYSQQLPANYLDFERYIIAVATVVFTVRAYKLASLNVLQPAIATAKSIFLTVLAITLMRYNGHDIGRWVEYVGNSPSIVIKLGLAWVVVKALSGAGFKPSSQGTDVTIGESSMIQAGRKPTAWDMRVSAVHEAGHALVYGAMGHLLENIKVELFPNTHSSVLGRVCGQVTINKVQNQTYLEWVMLVNLAGLAAEEFIFRFSHNGGGGDLGKWQKAARNYLGSGFGPSYLAQPANEAEARMNGASLGALRRYQTTLLHELFEDNQQVLINLAAKLAENKVLDLKQMQPFFDQMTFRSHFPQPGKAVLEKEELPMAMTEIVRNRPAFISRRRKTPGFSPEI